jgi:hypothetical protein
MISPSQYYEESLYPLQNGVLTIVNNCRTRFFLTGGTALSRAYYNHRYSDDLDFFVSNDLEYAKQVKMILGTLQDNGFSLKTELNDGFISGVGFTSLKVGWDKSDVLLKLDFVNDTVPHFGDLQKTAIFDRTDTVRNILSNKLSALFRYAAKDVADIREIALHETVNWSQMINEAREKEAGLDIPIICEILKGIPESELDTVHWVQKPDWQQFYSDIDRIVFDMMNG